MEAGQTLEAAKASSGRNRNGSGVDGDVTCQCAAAGDVAVVLEWEPMWVPSSALDVLRPLSAADVSRLAGPAGLGAWIAVVAVMMGVLALMAAWDERVVFVCHPPIWSVAPPAFSLRWRVFFHLRTRHALLRIVYAIPGHTPMTRLQMCVALFNQLLITACLCLAWYGDGQCFVEQTLLAGFISAATGVIFLDLSRPHPHSPIPLVDPSPSPPDLTQASWAPPHHG